MDQVREESNPIRQARPGAPWLTVVGVVGDVSDSHDPGVPLETWYLPLDQQAESPAAERFYLMVRDGDDPATLMPAVQRAVASVDKTLALYEPVLFSLLDAEAPAPNEAVAPRADVESPPLSQSGHDTPV